MSATPSELSFQRPQNVPRLPLLGSSRGQQMLATAAKELSVETRDGVRTDGSMAERRMSGMGVSLDLDSARRFSQTARPSLHGFQSTWGTPRDIMASGPQRLVVPDAWGRRKGIHTGVCLSKLTSEERQDHELRKVCEQLGFKAAQKFNTVREAFRYLDADHDGKISRSEMQYFFRAYNFPSHTADRFFDHLDRDKTGAVEYDEFMKYVVPYVQPTHGDSSCHTSECNSNASTRAPSPLGNTTLMPSSDGGKCSDPEIDALFEFVGFKSKEKFSHAREVFRLVDCNDDGNISRREMQYFFRVFNMSEANADKVFDHYRGTLEEVNYYEFVRILGPFLELPGTTAAMLQRPEGLPSHRQSRRSSLAGHSKASSNPKSSETSSIADAADLMDRSGATKMETREFTQAELEKEMRDVMKDIGEKLPLKFKHVRDAFRPLDLSHNGKITKVEMRSFLRGFGWSHDVADRFFRVLDEDACGEIDFNTFMAHFDVVLGPANRLAPRGDLVNVKDFQLRQEANQVALVLGEKLLTKFKSARHALTTLDLSNDGKITLADMRLFFRTMCMSTDAANKMFKLLRKDGADYVEYGDFLALFGTKQAGASQVEYGQASGRFRGVQELKGSARPSGPPVWTIM